VFAAFAPQESMRLFHRGIRRRLAPMFGSDRRRLELAYSLQFALPGTPTLRYGEEIGMGEDLSLKGRDAIRTPMQWDAGPHAGFAPASAERLIRPVVTGGDFGFEQVNVMAQRADPDSLLSWIQRLIAVRRECPEIGDGRTSLVDAPGIPREVLVHRADGARGSVLFLHNLSDTQQAVDLTGLDGGDGVAEELFADGDGSPVEDLGHVDLPPAGYRWIRLAGPGSH